MPIKNYTTRVSVGQSISEIQESLIKHGAIGFFIEYEEKTGRVKSLKFIIKFNDVKIPYQLPVDWRKFQRVLREQKVPRANDEDYCYRVAWRNIRDWVLAQMALFETEMVDLPQVFLPYAMNNEGKTIYELVQNQGFLLEAPK